MEEAAYSQPTDQLVQEQNQPENQKPQQSAPTTSFTIAVWKFFSVISWLLLIFTSLDAYFHETMFFSIFANRSYFSYFPLSVKLGDFIIMHI